MNLFLREEKFKQHDSQLRAIVDQVNLGNQNPISEEDEEDTENNELIEIDENLNSKKNPSGSRKKLK